MSRLHNPTESAFIQDTELGSPAHTHYLHSCTRVYLCHVRDIVLIQLSTIIIQGFGVGNS